MRSLLELKVWEKVVKLVIEGSCKTALAEGHKQNIMDGGRNSLKQPPLSRIGRHTT